MNPTLYDVIGVTPEASEDEIHRSIKKATKKIRESDIPREEMKNILRYIKQARETLMDPQRREEYDKTIGIETIRTTGDIVPFGGGGGGGGCDDLVYNPINSIISSHMNMLQSIIPEELGDMTSIGSHMKPGTFHFMEYTKVRNTSGGFDEFGLTREGDTNNDRVTEKRYHRKS